MKILTLFVFLSTLIFAFQNCGEMLGANKAKSESLETAFTEFSKSSIQNDLILFKSLSDTGKRYYYRIPSLVVVNNNKFMVAFAEQRVASNNDSGDINVVYRISYDHGQTWSKITRICELQRDTCGNPTAVVDQNTGIIHLFMNSNEGHKAQFAADGETFSFGDRRIRYLQAKFNGEKLEVSNLEDLTGTLQTGETKMDIVGPGVGIQLTKGSKKGRLIVPAANRSFISDNSGKSWRLSKERIANVSSESSIMELDNGNVLRNDRATGKFKCQKEEIIDTKGNLIQVALKKGSVKCRRVLSYSKDGADIFSSPSIDNNLIDPIAQGSMLRYSQGNLFMANCASMVRRRFLIIKSTIDGKTWKAVKFVDGECGYTSMAKTRDLKLAIIYERYAGKLQGTNYQDIIFKKYKLSELETVIDQE